MEFIFNSSNPKADTRWELEGVAESEEEKVTSSFFF